MYVSLDSKLNYHCRPFNMCPFVDSILAFFSLQAVRVVPFPGDYLFILKSLYHAVFTNIPRSRFQHHISLVMTSRVINVNHVSY